MSIRQKLLFLLVFTCTILSIHAAVMVRRYVINDQQVRIVGASIKELYGVTKTRSAIINHIVRSMDFRLTGKDTDRAKYDELEAKVWRAHAEWLDAIRRSRGLGQNKDEEEQRTRHVEKNFKDLRRDIAEAFTMVNSGKIAEAYNLLETKVEPMTDHVLNEEVDEAVTAEVKEVDAAYDEVLMRLGKMLWGGEEGIRQVKVAKVFKNYFLITDRLASNIRKEYKQLINYLVSGEDLRRQAFEERSLDISNDLQDWLKVIQEHKRFGGEEKRETLRVLEVEKRHNEFLELAERAFELRGAGSVDEVIEHFETKLRPFAENALIPGVLEETERAKRQIDTAHRALLNITLASGMTAILLLATVSTVIVFVLTGMIRKIIISLGELRRGTEIVGQGELGHRIHLGSNDELGQLASSFDKMAETLQRSRDEMVLAKEYTSNILRSMSDMLVVVSPDGQVQTVNDAVCSLLEYRENELIGEPAEKIFLEGPPFPSERIGLRGEKDEIGNVERTYLAKNGRKIPVSFSTSVMRNDSGEAEGIVCVAQDITERKQWEESLLTSESKFRRLSQEFHTLLDSIPYALLLLNPHLEVQWANNGATAVFGRKNTGLIGQHCHSLWYNSSSACSDCYVQRSFKTGKEESAHRSTPDGKFWDMRAIPIRDDSGEVRNVITIAVDVTEKTTLQAEAMQAAHLASLGELAAGVAHEINNPINSIINYAQILIDELPGESSRGELAARILKDGDRISNIVRSLLSFARVFEEEKSEVHLNELLANSLSLTETHMKKDGISLRISAPNNLPDIVAHSQQIEQVFLNVISNARYALIEKFPKAHEDKILEIKSESITRENNPFVRVTFLDRGTGIPPNILDKVVEPFFSTKPKGVGTGLGLSISHGIVSNHGGTMKIDSVEGLYTRVTIDLPAGRDG